MKEIPPLSSDAESLFNALDNDNFEEINACLTRTPECVNERDEWKQTPLHYAADNGNVMTFKKILTLNPSLIDAQDNAGLTPLMVAIMSGNINIVELLIKEGVQLAQIDTRKHSAVHWAVLYGEVKILECLLKNNAPFETADDCGAYPLHYAAAMQDFTLECSESTIHLLLNRGVNVNVADLNGRTPLIWAASNGNEVAFKSLIQAGANKFVSDKDKLSVLHCAAFHGHASILRLFFEKNDSNEQFVNAKDRNGDTPLFYACTHGHYECAKIFLDKGADSNHMDKRCRSPAHCAAAKGQLRIMKLLRQYGASFQLQNNNGDLAFHEAVQTGSLNLVEWMLQLDSNFVLAANFYDRTALHLAAASGNLELTVLLCNRGAKINPLMLYKNELYTPLDLAQRRGHTIIVEYLSQRHEAQTAEQISSEKQLLQLKSIKENLKTAKLRRMRAQISTSSSDEGPDMKMDTWNNHKSDAELISGFSINGRKYKIFRRHNSMRNDNNHTENDAENEEPEFFISRNIRSAPGIRSKNSLKLEDLQHLHVEKQIESSQNDEQLKKDAKNNINTAEFDKKHETIISRQPPYIEESIVESAFKKVIKEHNSSIENDVSFRNETNNKNEIEKDKVDINLENGISNESTINSITEPSDSSLITGKKKNKHVKLIDINTPSHTMADLDNTRSRQRLISPSMKQDSFSSVYHHNQDILDGTETSDAELYADADERNEGGDINDVTITSHHYQTSQHRIRSAKKNKGYGSLIEKEIRKRVNDKKPKKEKDKIELAELHIIEDGWQPTYNDNEQSFIGSTVERRYVHEKAIFEELTHLKRMQIQYGRVQERVLVRTLVANFCKMHGLNSSHFNYQTFHEWEKFLYDLLSDQLKMVYLEEKWQIQPSLASLPSNSTNVLASLTGNIPIPSHRSTTRNSHLSFLSSLASTSRRFENRLHKANLLDERLRELTRIYSNSSVSAAAVMSRQRRHALSLTRQSKDGASVPPLFLPKHNSKMNKKLYDPHHHYVPHHHNSYVENGGTTSEGATVGGGKRCECLERGQRSEQEKQEKISTK